MRTVTYKLEDLKTKVIHIGKVAENDATRVQIDAGSVFAEYPAAVPTMSMINPDGTAFPVSVERSGDLVLWDVKDSELAAEGQGEIQFTFTDGNTVAKSVVGRVQICRSIVGNGEAPDPIQDWMTEADAALEEIENISATAETLSAGSQATASYADGVLSFGIPQGAQGAPGQDGQDGADGQDGEDGVSPTVAVTEITGGHTVTITDAQGDHAFNVMDGTAGAVIDDTAGAGDTDKTWSADKLTSDVLSALNSRPESVGTDASGVDLDIVDPNGYVLARFNDGHFKTKNFDSKDAEKASATVFTDAEHSGLDVIDENGNVILRLMSGNIQTKNFDSKEAINPVEYKFSGNDLLIGYGYNSTHDAVVVMNEGRANNLFDFSDFKLKQKGIPLSGLETADLVSVWHSGTDMHGPFEFLAVNNPDGVKAESTDPGWTGGIHTVDNSGDQLQTASTKYIHVFADGVPVSSGYGRCNNLEIRWANNVQAYNCVKADGTGRTSMIEYHDIVFDGIRFNEKVKLSPTEDVKMQLWYGFQGVAFGSVYENVEFVDATNRQTFTTIDSSTVSGNSVTSGVRGYGDDHAVEILVDISTDLGKRDYYSGTEGAFAIESTGKTYFNIIRKFGSSQVVMNENTNYYLNGSYRFYPVVQ